MVVFVAVAATLAFGISRRDIQNRVETIVVSKGGWLSNSDLSDDLRVYPELPEIIPEWLHKHLPRRLNYVHAATNEFDDSDVDTIVKLPGLRGVNLSGTKITNVGLEKLANCKSLEYLLLFGVQGIDDDDIAFLKTKLPMLFSSI